MIDILADISIFLQTRGVGTKVNAVIIIKLGHISTLLGIKTKTTGNQLALPLNRPEITLPSFQWEFNKSGWLKQEIVK